MFGKFEKKMENKKETLYLFLFGLCSPATDLLFPFSRFGPSRTEPVSLFLSRRVGWPRKPWPRAPLSGDADD
jgi:hypothetical protein